MTRITHMLGGAVIGGLVCKYGIIIGAIAGGLPDIDIKLFGEGKDWNWHLFKHRGITHTLLFAFCLTVISYFILSHFHYSKIYALIIFLALLSHIALDTLNFQEEKPFYPVKTGIYFKILKVETLQEYLFITLPLFLIFIEIIISKYILKN
ncbi:MAG: metal-dependent hydrolase [Candidatus Acididesulfobacter guangdongensis]|uniref:Metal-dependent hydrolase n=1 Tax=Acididesulfobacter guangdongensis TaxID=2597225 RepID=A0A519BHE6_ACIG2|nr:MAG: metal-dependent hydrolase [Candidatus Acididesulfobacter guangdongensis]